MLEARHLRKTYKTKKGATTRALDDVSVTFAEKGMVFILGKSGSGKSTLLNVCGGLDTMDSGEILIKGRSSADKGDFDFDSYRNTFVGFVFQEYNILEEFTVEENVALALELQHKKRDKEVIAKILADVDMTQYANRKPNTLSGGQKQRVAIARALVKNPEIIMADEPTGALDSNTGKQVFDTLKKLSENKLVLVVSHDREFAEQYGDRIIELKDGKIISDMTRQEDESDADAKNVRFVGTDTVCVQSAAELTDEDFASIKAFLSKSKGSAVITASRSKVDDITRELRGGEFETTAAQPAVREYSANEKKMIRSRLPLKHAVKMGASSLKSKPIRLAFTILLSLIAFILFGVFSTLMLYDADQVNTNAFMESGYDFIGFNKKYDIYYEQYHNGELDNTYVSPRDTKFTLEEFKTWQQKYPKAMAAVSAESMGSWNGVSLNNLTLNNTKQQFYGSGIEYFLLANEGLTLLGSNGRVPQEDNEILISDFVFNALKAGEFVSVTETGNSYTTGAAITLTDYDSIVGKKIVLGSRNDAMVFTITGVFKGAGVPSAYSDVKDAVEGGNEPNSEKLRQWSDERAGGLFACVAMTENMFTSLKGESNQNTNYQDVYFRNNVDTRVILHSSEENVGSYNIYYMKAYPAGGADASDPALAVYDVATGNEIASPVLSSGQLIINASNLVSNWHVAIERYVEELGNTDSDKADALYEMFHFGIDIPGTEYFAYWNSDTQDYVRAECTDPSHWEGNSTCIEHYCDTYDGVWLKRFVEKTMSIEDKLYLIGRNDQEVTVAEKAAAYKEVAAFVAENSIPMPSFTFMAENENNGFSQSVTVSGVFFDPSQNNDLWACAYASEDLLTTFNYNDGYISEWTSKEVTKYKEDPNAFIGNIFIPYDGNEELTKELVQLSGKRAEDDSFAMISNSLMESLEFVNGFIEEMGTIFMWLGIVLAAFSFLLMFNFISASITAKKKEIGILRAIGSRTWDVFKIFLSEAVIIALICFVLATAGSIGVCALLNNILMEESAMFATGLLVFGPLSILIIAGIALLTAVVATVIPVATYSRKPPIASIRAL